MRTSTRRRFFARPNKASGPCARPDPFNGRRHFVAVAPGPVRASPIADVAMIERLHIQLVRRTPQLRRLRPRASASPRRKPLLLGGDFAIVDASMIRRWRALLAGAPISRWQLRVAA